MALLSWNRRTTLVQARGLASATEMGQTPTQTGTARAGRSGTLEPRRPTAPAPLLPPAIDPSQDPPTRPMLLVPVTLSPLARHHPTLELVMVPALAQASALALARESALALARESVQALVQASVRESVRALVQASARESVQAWARESVRA